MTDKDEILIDKYLRGALSSEDKILFEERMLDDSFKVKWEEATALLQVLREQDGKQMKTILEKAEYNIDRRNRMIKLLALGIAAIILGVLSYFYILSNKKVDKDTIYAAYYEPYPNIVDPIVKGGPASLSIYQQYELKSYQKVVAKLRSDTNLNEDEKFYLACSYLGVGNIEEASSLFKETTGYKKYGDASSWYLALICIKEKRSDCKSKISNIAANKSHVFSKRAEELLVSLSLE